MRVVVQDFDRTGTGILAGSHRSHHQLMAWTGSGPQSVACESL